MLPKHEKYDFVCKKMIFYLVERNKIITFGVDWRKMHKNLFKNPLKTIVTTNIVKITLR